jgi:hypothetical protein
VTGPATPPATQHSRGSPFERVVPVFKRRARQFTDKGRQCCIVADRAVPERLLHRRRVDPKENPRATAGVSDRRPRLRERGTVPRGAR